MKAAKLKKTINLSRPDGVKDVSIGRATPERRQERDFSKKWIRTSDPSTFDDYKQRMKRWGGM